MTDDALQRLLEQLPMAEPDPRRAERVLRTCHAALSRSRPVQPVRRRQSTPVWESAALGVLCVGYLSEVVRLTLQLSGLL